MGRPREQPAEKERAKKREQTENTQAVKWGDQDELGLDGVIKVEGFVIGDDPEEDQIDREMRLQRPDLLSKFTSRLSMKQGNYELPSDMSSHSRKIRKKKIRDEIY